MFALALVLTSSIFVAPAPNADSVVFEVAAGDLDRSDVAVAAELPASLASDEKFTLVRLDTQQPVAWQLDRSAGTRLWWIVAGRLPARTARRYRLSSSAVGSPASTGVSVTNDGRKLVVSVGTKHVLSYNSAVVPSPNPKEPYYAKSGYLHPLLSPAGRLVTDDFNPDHAHQHGVMFAWRKTTCEGRSTNGWDQKSALGKVEHVKVDRFGGGPIFGHFTVRLHQVDLTAPGGVKPILDEIWRVRIENHTDRHLVDLESTQTCASRSPVTIDQYTYGGLMIRGAVSWSKHRDYDYLTSEGKNKKDGNATRPRWVDLAGPVDGGPCGVLSLDHPANFRFPQPVRLHPTMPYFCFAPAILGSFNIEPGTQFVSRYRFVVYDGRISATEADRLWSDYARPAQVRIVTQ